MASLINLQAVVDGIQSTITSISNLVSGKADSSNTLNGYGIADAYTKTEVSSLVDARISTVIGTATANLDTLGEIGAQLANDESAVAALVNTVAGKEATITAGTTTQYFRGDKTWSSFIDDVLNTLLTGLSVATSTAVVSTDNLLVAVGKIQAQINNINAIVEAFILTISSAIVEERSATATLSNKTLDAPIIKNYTEFPYSANVSGNVTIDLNNGTLQELILTANTTFTLPTSVNGKSYTLIIGYNGTFVPSFTGGSTLKWSGQAAPPAKSTAGFFDIFVFTCDGTNTFGRSGGSNF